MSTPIKRCSKCGKEFPATREYFYQDNRRGGRLHASCKACMQAVSKRWRDAHPETIKASVERSLEKHRDERLARRRERYRENPIADRERSRRWKEANPDRVREHKRRSYQNNPYRTIERSQEWAKSNRERSRERSRRWKQMNPVRVQTNNRNRMVRKRSIEGAHTAADVQAQYNRQRHCCYYCGCELNGKYHVDHVIPLSRGGSNGPENIVCACQNCNLQKGAKLPHEWPNGGRLL